MPTLLVFGARNLGRAIATSFAGDGWDVVGFARSAETLSALQGELPAALPLQGDAARPEDVERAFTEAEARFGRVDLVVNAVSVGVPAGELAEAPANAMAPYLDALVPAVFNVLRVGVRVLAEQGGGTLVQITGGSARRAMPGRGPWAAASFATRALTQAASLEGRDRNVHVALLIVDATIASAKTADRLEGSPEEGSTTEEDVVRAIAYLEGQSSRAWSHELQITPRLDRWVP